MPTPKTWKVCAECHRPAKRCRAASVQPNGEIEWICVRCWKELDYDHFLYEYWQQHPQLNNPV